MVISLYKIAEILNVKHQEKNPYHQEDEHKTISQSLGDQT